MDGGEGDEDRSPRLLELGSKSRHHRAMYGIHLILATDAFSFGTNALPDKRDRCRPSPSTLTSKRPATFLAKSARVHNGKDLTCEMLRTEVPSTEYFVMQFSSCNWSR